MVTGEVEAMPEALFMLVFKFFFGCFRVVIDFSLKQVYNSHQVKE